MRICVISTPVFSLPCSGYSGLEVIAWEQAKGLAKLGHQVALVAPEGSWCPGVQIIPNGPAGRIDEHASYQLYWKFLPQFDVVVDHSWSKFSYLLKQEGVLKAPVLGVCHAPINTMYQQLPTVPKPCMVCISQDQANHFQALFNRKAEVCYNGIDLDTYKPLNLPRSNRFLFLARFSSIKGPDIAIEACKKAGVGLDLVGDTTITNEPELLARCQAMADGDQIRIIGNQPRGNCVWWFSQAHALIHANMRFREPFGLAPVEAMACGCPVACFDNGAMRETVKQGRTGVICQEVEEFSYTIESMKDKVVVIAGDKKARNWWHNPDMRKECQEHASQFTVDRMALRMGSLCQLALDKGGW